MPVTFPRFLGLQLPRLLLVAALGLPLGASALALGEATVKSFLGQRLDAVIDIASLSPAEAAALTVRAASPEAFADAKLDYSGLIRSLRFTLDKQGERTRVRISSDLPIFDPFLILLVEVEANESRTIRQYALLFDPPPLDDTAAMGEAITPPVIQVAPAASTAPTLATPQVTAQATPEVPPQASPLSTAQASTSTAEAKPLSSESSRQVRSGETLFGIASALKPPEFSVEQMMIALQNSNPDAFISKNVNRLKAGSVLGLPGADSLATLDAKQAQGQIREQRREFLRYQAALASRATSTAASATPSTPAPAIRSNSGQVGVQPEPAPQPSASKDQLKLSTPGKDAAGKTGLNSRQALDKIAAAKAQQDANSRIQQLEKNIDQLQQAIVVRDQNLALAQQRAQAAASAPAATQSPNSAPKAEQATPVIPPATAEAAPATSTAATSETIIEATTAAAQSASVLALARVQQLGKELVIQAKAVWRSGKVQARKVLPLVEEFVKSDSGRAAIISLPLTLPLMALLWRARGKRKAAEREPAASREEGEITPEGSAFATDQAQPMASVSPLAAKGHVTQPVDAIAEADVYVAYGRTEQAEEILLDALSSQPEAHAYRLKLLEIYAARGDHRAFEAMYQDLQAASRGQGSLWAQAQTLAQQRRVAKPEQYSPQPLRSEQGLAPAPSAALFTATSPTASPLADFERKLQGMLGERQGISALGTASEFGSSSDAATSGQRIEPSLAVIDLAALQTKLELAVACEEIGDHEGARELLAEVARARHPELAQRAQSLLQQIA